MPDGCVIGIVVVVVVMFAIMAAEAWLGVMLYGRVNDLMARQIEYELKSEESEQKRTERREVLTTIFNLSDGVIPPECRATSADE